jgi:hypothetical protein
MKNFIEKFVIGGWFLAGLIAPVQATTFFEEQFDGPTLDSSVWRSEVQTAGVRWCDLNAGAWWGQGTWVEEGSECYGAFPFTPYGAAILSNGLLRQSAMSGFTFPFLVSRLPGSIEVFPPSGDFSLEVKMRYVYRTAMGVGLVVYQTQDTEPSGANPPVQLDNVLLNVWADPDLKVKTAIEGASGGELVTVALVTSPDLFHEYTLDCVGNTFTISVDDQLVYGPVTSTLRPTAVWIGNPALIYTHITEWGCINVDYFRVELPGPVPAVVVPWGGLKASYRD